jgi:DNA repair protein RadC
LRESLTPAERPRERLTQFGSKALTEAELVALLLGSGVKGRNAVGIANDLLANAGGLRGLQRLDLKSLANLKGLGPARASLLTAAFEIGERASLSAVRSGDPMQRPEQVKAYCRIALSNLPIEYCIGIWLDVRNHLIACDEFARGTLNQTTVYTREVVAKAIKHHACALVLAHNHPAGTIEPSPDDILLTKSLAKALELIDVVIVDHIIVAGPSVLSLREQGYSW